MALTKRIIPCLDVSDGHVVKGVKFENLEGVGYPPDLAQRYESQGADEIVFLDITASIEARQTLFESVEKTVEKLFIPLTVGGGIRSVEDMRAALKAGADKVSISSAAVQSPDLIDDCVNTFGRQRMMVAIDAKREGDSWIVYTQGGRKNTGIDVISWATEVQDRGAGEILLTSMDADGTTNGYDLELTDSVSEAVSIPVIASGGCGGPEHMYDVFQQTGASAALAASIFHYGAWTVSQVKDYLRDKGVAIR
ncbi:MAG: imidazole glycerol phosphate synthase subunit HisF [Euryarchaeota archaeon]|nr:imidazole glycerol phosphate synthase subunit HisF [Euryarchaeota archaeon]